MGTRDISVNSTTKKRKLQTKKMLWPIKIFFWRPFEARPHKLVSVAILRPTALSRHRQQRQAR